MRQFGVSNYGANTPPTHLSSLEYGDVVAHDNEPCLVIYNTKNGHQHRALVSLQAPGRVWNSADHKVTLLGHLKCTLDDFE